MRKRKKRHTFYQVCIKRGFDFMISLLALIVLVPIFFIIYISSKISIGGKVMFCQYRPGKDGKIFKLYKFRSMTNETDENGMLLPDEKRITKFGKFLRKTSLDELPQLLNIIKGDMSIIGPRPRLVKDMIFYSEETLKAYCVKPGLTGPSQISGGRSESSWESIFEEDLKYSQNITFFNDLKIFFKTIGAIFKSDGSSEGAESSKRDYYYCDYLLKQNKISPSQYALGLAISDEIISSNGKVEFQKDLHTN